MVFFLWAYAGLIERWGTGTFKMVRLCLEKGLPEPEFREEAEGFVVLLRKDIYTEDYFFLLKASPFRAGMQ